MPFGGLRNGASPFLFGYNSMAVPNLLTLQDAVEHVQGFLESAGDDRNNKHILRAVKSAYRTLAFCRTWKYFLRQHRIRFSAPYSTGTIVYDHTGGANEREVTLTTGTWPTWALYGTLRIAGVNHEIESRVSNSVVTLTAANNPGADVASGTSYTLYRAIYTLPSDYWEMMAPSGENQWWQCRVSPQQWMQLDRHNSTSAEPQAWTVMGDPNLIGSKALFLWPYPSSAASFDFLYSKLPRDLYYTGYEANSTVGTVASMADSTTITGTSTAFAAAHVGSIIRFSSTSTDPDGESGPNPFIEQKVITARASATSLTVDSEMDNTLSGVGYRITDPIDLHPTMIEAFLAGCESQVARVKSKAQWERSEAYYRQTLMQAFEADNDGRVMRSPLDGVPGYVPYTVTASAP